MATKKQLADLLKSAKGLENAISTLVSRVAAAVDNTEATMDITEIDGDTRIAMVSDELMVLQADSKNPEYRHGYTSLAGFLKVLKPLLKKYKLSVEHQTDEQALTTAVKCLSTGEGWASIELPLYGVREDDPQSLAASITYTRRMALGLLFNVATEVDDDANSISPVAEKKKKSSPKPTAKPATMKDRDFYKHLEAIEVAETVEQAKDMALRLRENFILSEEQEDKLQELIKLAQ